MMGVGVGRQLAVDGSRATAGSPGAPAHQKTAGWLRGAAESVVLFAALAALWQLLTDILRPLYFPTPLTIARVLIGEWFSWSGLATHIMPSLIRVTLGWALAVTVGVSLGVAIGLLRDLAGFVYPLVHFARAVPPPVVLPVFLIFFGVGDAMKVVFVAFGVVWPVLMNAIKGVQSVDSTWLETAKVYGIRGMRFLLHVILPAASPEIFAGLRISLSLSFVLMVISEIISATGGIGFQILNSQASFDIVNMWAGMVVLGIGGILYNAALSVVEKHVLRWHHGLRGGSS